MVWVLEEVWVRDFTIKEITPTGWTPGGTFDATPTQLLMNLPVRFSMLPMILSIGSKMS
jgi:hypothetical protein